MLPNCVSAISQIGTQICIAENIHTQTHTCTHTHTQCVRHYTCHSMKSRHSGHTLSRLHPLSLSMCLSQCVYMCVCVSPPLSLSLYIYIYIYIYIYAWVCTNMTNVCRNSKDHIDVHLAVYTWWSLQPVYIRRRNKVVQYDVFDQTRFISYTYIVLLYVDKTPDFRSN